MRLLTVLLLLGSVATARPLREGDWTPAVRARLDAFLDKKRTDHPVATFDWDNTMMKNDIGDIAMGWMLRHDALLLPADWSGTSGALSAAALSSLKRACRGEANKPLRTSTMPACADEILAIYRDGKTAAGAPAWKNEVTLTTNEAYAWEARLLGGQTPEQVRAHARLAYAEAAVAPVGATRTVGTHKDVPAWVRIYPQMKDLVDALKESGFEVWIVSASPQVLAEVVALEVGIAPDHVVGVRVTMKEGRYQSELESCGDAPTNSLITFNLGKRCWINKAIFHLPVADQLKQRAAHAFAAGDSDTDVTFVRDARELKLVLDRHHVQLMCNALANAGQRWLSQPMFLEPMAPPRESYPCASAKDAAGAPIVDEEGRPIGDQRDPRSARTK